MRLRGVLASLLGTVALLTAAFVPLAARADESAPPVSTSAAFLPPAPAQDQTVISWYGYQSLGADALAVGLLVGGDEIDGGNGNEGLLGLGLLAYALGGPLVHVRHGNHSRAAASLAIRLGLPIAGAVAGFALTRNCEDVLCIDGFGGTAVGAVVGFGSAILIDDVGLAYEEHPVSGPTWTPTLRASANGGMSFGVGGTF